MERRKFMAAMTTGAVITIAGCSDGTDSDVDTSSAAAVVESYYEVLDEFDQDSSADDVIDAVEPAFHSASPLPDILREMKKEGGHPGAAHDIVSIEAEVIDENLGAGRLNQEFESEDDYFDQEDINALTKENAIVEADIEHEEAPSGKVRRLTTPEDGDWLIVV